MQTSGYRIIVLPLFSAAVVFQLSLFLDQATVAMNGRERSQIIIINELLSTCTHVNLSCCIAFEPYKFFARYNWCLLIKNIL